MRRKLIFVSSPLRGDIQKNLEMVKKYCKLVVDEGHIPFAPHLFYTQFLDDEIGDERCLGMQMGLDMLELCDELWAFPTWGKVSEGMSIEIKLAKELKKTVFFRHLGETNG